MNVKQVRVESLKVMGELPARFECHEGVAKDETKDVGKKTKLSHCKRTT